MIYNIHTEIYTLKRRRVNFRSQSSYRMALLQQWQQLLPLHNLLYQIKYDDDDKDTRTVLFLLNKKQQPICVFGYVILSNNILNFRKS